MYAMSFDTNGNGASSFQYPDGTTLPVGQVACTFEQYQNPSQWTLVNGSLVQSLTYAKAAQSALIKQGFANANAANISFTDAAGVTDTYQADPTSVADLNNCLSAFRAAAAVPSGFYWRSATNNNNAFTYADLVNLAAALANRGFANFAQLQTLKANVMAATTVSDVQAVVW